MGTPCYGGCYFALRRYVPAKRERSVLLGQVQDSVRVEIAPEARDMYIHFTARNGAPGRFNRFPTPSGSSNIYINPIKPDWYLGGLPCFGGLEDTINELRTVISEAKPSRITVIGSSMGAWGAAYYAPMLGANTAILFGPELALNCFGGFSLANLGKTPQSELPKISVTAGCRYITVSGGMSPSDLACSINFFSDDHSECFIIPRMSHGTSAELNNLWLLDRIIAEIAVGRSSVLEMLQHPEKDSIIKFFRGKEYDLSVITEYLMFHAKKNGYGRMVLHIAEDLANKRHLKAAASIIGGAPPHVSGDIEAKAILLTCAVKLKDYDRVLSITSDMSLNPKHRQRALWERGLALEAMGKHSDARDVFLLLCEECAKDEVFIKSLDKLKTIPGNSDAEPKASLARRLFGRIVPRLDRIFTDGHHSSVK